MRFYKFSSKSNPHSNTLTRSEIYILSNQNWNLVFDSFQRFSREYLSMFLLLMLIYVATVIVSKFTTISTFVRSLFKISAHHMSRNISGILECFCTKFTLIFHQFCWSMSSLHMTLHNLNLSTAFLTNSGVGMMLHMVCQTC